MVRSMGEISFKRGQWSPEEDQKLIAYIHKYRIWNWNHMAYFSGLTRSGKSCRLRWMNYLRPNIKHGNFSKNEEEIIVNMQQQFGNKWSLIASRLPGRTDNEIKNYWNTRFKRRIKQKLRLSEITRSETFVNWSGDSGYGSSSNPTGLEVSSNLSYSSPSVDMEEPFEWVMELGSLWEEPFQVKSSEAIHIIQDKEPLSLCAFFDGDVIW